MRCLYYVWTHTFMKDSSWKNKCTTCIIHLCHDLKLWRLHAFLYVTCIDILSRYDEYGYIHIISMYAIILCGLLSLHSSNTVSVCWLKDKPKGYICTCLMTPCARTKQCVEKYYISNFCPDWKPKFKTIKYFYEKFVYVCIANPTSEVTYWIFSKILKSCTTLIF